MGAAVGAASIRSNERLAALGGTQWRPIEVMAMARGVTIEAMGRAFVGFQSRGGNGAGPGHGFRRDNMQAEVLLLSDLNTALRHVTVRARVARVWEFHKDNQLAHVDIVFVDEQGNQMYGEIQAMHAEIFKEKLKEGLGEQMPALRLTSGNDDQYNAAYNRDDPETIDVAFLNSSDPNEFLGKNMKSTLTIMRLASEHWWFLSCQLCHKKAFQATNAFVCSNKRCNCTTATPRYKVRVIGADKTGEVEFVFFATVAEQIIGKRLEVVMRNARPSIVRAEISALISQKLTFNYTVNERGLQYGQLSFQVNSVTATHKKTNVFEFNKLSFGSSSTSTQESGENSKDYIRHSEDYYLKEETAP
ncbi:hypothetical protein ZWY2020_018195 [Hordeum vulgare]|nr:hypothetical protein ZWY2020_018195 [Hordeum vulgare]